MIRLRLSENVCAFSKVRLSRYAKPVLPALVLITVTAEYKQTPTFFLSEYSQRTYVRYRNSKTVVALQQEYTGANHPRCCCLVDYICCHVVYLLMDSTTTGPLYVCTSSFGLEIGQILAFSSQYIFSDMRHTHGLTYERYAADLQKQIH